VLAQELFVVDGDALSFRAVRPLLDVALRLEQNDNDFSWHGWNRQQIDIFLASLPSMCTLVIGVWETVSGHGEGEIAEHEKLALGCVCEVRSGEVQSICTFESLVDAGLRAIDQLEPGIEDALEIMRAARVMLSPVAYALFIEKTAWDEWLFASGEDGGVIAKGEELAELARQGRCVLMGSQAAPHHC